MFPDFPTVDFSWPPRFRTAATDEPTVSLVDVDTSAAADYAATLRAEALGAAAGGAELTALPDGAQVPAMFGVYDPDLP